MQIHVASPAVVRGEMEHQIHAPHRFPCYAVFQQVGLDKFNRAFVQQVGHVLALAAR
jgi:hypothetical protein